MINLKKVKNPMPEQDPVVRAGNFKEVAEGYTPEMAINEAMRCLNCRKKPCTKGCPVMVNIPAFVAKVAEGDLKNFNPSFTPAGSDVASLWKELNKDLVAGASDVINILMQVGFGTNPQTLVDAALAIYDAAEGDMELSKEIGIALLRIMNAPQSNIDMLVMDEINFKVDEGLDMSIEEFARRYADYKAKRNAPYTYPLYSNEGQKKAENKYIKRFVNDAEELKRTRGNEEAKAFYGYYDDEYEVVGKTIGEYKKEVKLAAKRDQDEEKAVLKEDFRDYRGEYSYYEFKQLRSKIAKYERYQKEMQIAVDPYVKAEYEQKMLEARRAMVTLREILENGSFKNSKSKILFCDIFYY